MSFVDRHTKARYSMGAKLDSLITSNKRMVPPPNNYEPSVTMTKLHSPKFKIGSSPRAPTYDQRNAKLVPAPNCYNLKPIAFESDSKKTRFHMGINLQNDSLSHHNDPTRYIHSIPGPGTHQPTTELTKIKAPKYSMGERFNRT